MKNLVISRKGFDATREVSLLLSLLMEIFSPFPSLKKQSPTKYRELRFNDLSGREILDLIGAKSISDDDFYHNDPHYPAQRYLWPGRWVAGGIR